MMRNKTYIALFAALMAVVLVMSGCSFFAPDTANLGAAGKGKIALSISGVNARTIMPKATYQVEFIQDGDVVDTQEWVSGTINVDAGTYTVKVTALVDGVPFAEGSEDDVEVEDQESTDVEITLTTITSTETEGTFSWDLSAFEAAASVSIAIFDAADDIDVDTAKEELTLGDGADAEFADTIVLDAGQYIVVIDVDGVKWTEVLYIFPGFTSKYTPSFDDVVGELADEQLLDIVLLAISTDNFTDILAGHFAPLGVNGVSAGNFNAVKAAITAILAEEDNAAPEDLAELKQLIDSTLVYVGAAAGIDTANDAAIKAAINGLVKNGTTLTIDTAKYEDDKTVAVTAGAYTFTATVSPLLEPETLEQLTLAESYAVYKFVLPKGATYGDYKSITVSYKMDATNLALATRSLRLHGNYGDLTKFVADDNNTYAFDASNAAYIYDDIGTGAITAAGAAADAWFTLTYRLVGNAPNGGFDAANNKPANTATGPFYFGIGIPGGSAGSASTPKIQLVKNITMVHSDDPNKNVVTTDFFGFVGKVDKDNDATGWALACKREVVANDDYVAPSGSFLLDLTEENLTTEQSSGLGTDGIATGEVTDGVLTWTFAQNGRRGWIKLSEEQVAAVMAASNLRITINGTADPDINFRYGLADPNAGGSWQSTNLQEGSFFAIKGERTPGFVSGQKDDARVGHFLLQQREAGTTTVTIKSIRIQCID
jgi:hypothetical protein